MGSQRIFYNVAGAMKIVLHNARTIMEKKLRK